ncbi:MAG: hypothetical protein Q9190_002331 [Brigantiaea leucoxantha]
MPVGLGTEEFELKGSGNEESAHEFAQGSGVFQIHQASKRGYTEGIVIIIEEDRPINHHHDVTNRYRDQGWAILGEMKRQANHNGFGKPVSALENYDSAVTFFKYVYAFEFTYVLAISTMKFSV